MLPDYHAIKGSNGGYAFPLYDRRQGPDAANINPVLVAALAEAYGQPIAPEAIFDAILCLLSASSYTVQFAEDLEDTFPHIPFPATYALFEQAAAIGAEIRALQAFQREPAAAFRPKGFCRLAVNLDGKEVVSEVGYADGTLSLWKDSDGKAVPTFTGLPDPVWSFAVSGYRVLPRWIEGRKGLTVESIYAELRDVAARIAELMHWFAAADLVLIATLAHTLTRAEMGFPAPAPEEADEGDD